MLPARLVLLAHFALFMTALPATAQFQIGDMVIAQAGGNAAPGHLDWYRNGSFVRRLGDLAPFWDVRFDLLGTLYQSSNGGPLYKYDLNAALVGYIYADGGFAGTIVIDSSGNFYTSQWIQERIAKISPASELLLTHDVSALPRQTPATADLAADQCTLFFTSPRDPVIGRYDVCSGVRLPDFTTSLPHYPVEVRLLLDGSLLVAAGPNVLLLNPEGTITKTFSVGPGAFFSALALDPGGQTFWASSGNVLIQFNFRDGSVVGQIGVPQNVTSIAILGEPRAATGGAAIPALDPTLLVALCLMLAAIGVSRML